MRLTSEGRSSPIFRLGDDEATSAEIWANLPPHYWYMEAPRKQPAAFVLAEHPTATGPDGPVPLAAYQFVGAGKSLFLGVDDTWRWRIGVGDRYFGRFWVQALRFMARNRLGRDAPAELTTDRAVYRSDQPTLIRVRFRNPGLAPRSGEVNVELSRQGRETERITLAATGEAGDTFEAILIPNPPPGGYRARLLPPPIIEGDPPTAEFRVEAPADERDRVQLDRDELARAAALSGGSYVELLDGESLLDDLPPARKIPLDTDPPIPLWNDWRLLCAVPRAPDDGMGPPQAEADAVTMSPERSGPGSSPRDPRHGSSVMSDSLDRRIARLRGRLRRMLAVRGLCWAAFAAAAGFLAVTWTDWLVPLAWDVRLAALAGLGALLAVVALARGLSGPWRAGSTTCGWPRSSSGTGRHLNDRLSSTIAFLQRPGPRTARRRLGSVDPPRGDHRPGPRRGRAARLRQGRRPAADPAGGDAWPPGRRRSWSLETIAAPEFQAIAARRFLLGEQCLAEADRAVDHRGPGEDRPRDVLRAGRPRPASAANCRSCRPGSGSTCSATRSRRLKLLEGSLRGRAPGSARVTYRLSTTARQVTHAPAPRRGRGLPRPARRGQSALPLLRRGRRRRDPLVRRRRRARRRRSTTSRSGSYRRPTRMPYATDAERGRRRRDARRRPDPDPGPRRDRRPLRRDRPTSRSPRPS